MHYKRLTLVIFLSILAIMAVFYGMSQQVLATYQPAPAVPLMTASVTTTASAARFYTTHITIPTYPYADYLVDVFTPTYNMTYTHFLMDAYQNSNPTPTVQT